MKLNGKEIKFARIGGLSPVKQKGYDPSMPGMHSPPCKKGLYAFLHPYYEPFLLSGGYSEMNTKHSKFERIKDKDGNVIQVDADEAFYEHNSSNWMKFWGLYRKNKEDDSYNIIKPKKPKVFKYEGEIWHHLGEHLKPNEILMIKGTWYLTDFKAYTKALRKEFSVKQKLVKNELKIETSNPFSVICVDHLEVFIENI